MHRITLQNLTKYFGADEIVSDFSLEMISGMKVAVVGPNGCGKSTLLKLVTSDMTPDSGRVLLSKGLSLGWSAQELEPEILDMTLMNWLSTALPSWADFWDEFDQAAASGDQSEIDRLSLKQTYLERILGHNPEYRMQAILSDLGFKSELFDKPLAYLSGGWKERAKLARALIAGTDALILDEPTNHLDLDAVVQLEKLLQSYPGILVFVDHERFFIDRVASHVLFMGGRKPEFARGNFSAFIGAREEAMAQREREYEKLSAEISRQSVFINRFRYKSTKSSAVQSRVKAVERMEKKLEGMVKERKYRSFSFSWPEPKRGNQTVLSLVDLDFSFPDGKRLWPPLSFNIYQGAKIGLVGANGSGKSTLLKLIMGRLKADSGIVKMGSAIVPAFYSQHQTEILRRSETVLNEIRSSSDPNLTEEELRSVLGLFDLGEEYWNRQVAGLSGGEKNRLVLATLFLARANFLVLDEPTNHLDMESREALIQALDEYTGTILLVAHDRYLLSAASREIWEMGTDGLRVFPGGYGDYSAERERRAAKAEIRDKPEEPGGRVVEKIVKRERAEARNKLYRELKPRREEMNALESRLEENLEAQAEIEARLADPATYADPGEAVRLNREFVELKNTAENIFERMAALEEEIGGIQGRYTENQ